VNPEIPVINICTESHVLFNYEKVIDFHDLNEIINDFKSDLINDSLNLKKCPKFERKYIYKAKECILDNDYILVKWYKFKDYIFKNMINNSNYNDMKNMTPNVNDFIKCKKTDENLMRNCSEFLDIKQNIFSNDFGICYEFRKSIKYNFDSIIFVLDYKRVQQIFNFIHLIQFDVFKQLDSYLWKSLQLNHFSDKYFKVFIYSDDYRGLNWLRDRALVIDELGIRGEIIVSKTTVEWLSTPYMIECRNYSKFYMNYIII